MALREVGKSRKKFEGECGDCGENETELCGLNFLQWAAEVE